MSGAIQPADHVRAAEIMRLFALLGTRMSGGEDYQTLLRQLAEHRARTADQDGAGALSDEIIAFVKGVARSDTLFAKGVWKARIHTARALLDRLDGVA